MENETETNLAGTPEVSTAETPEADQPEIETEDTQDSEDGQETEQTDEEFDEFEDEDGVKYKVPKAIVPKLMMQRDYTRKTQEIAEQRRAFEAEAQAREEAYALREEVFQDSAALTNVEQRLNAYRNVNWAAWQSQDPQGANAALADYTQLRDVHANLQQQVSYKASQLQSRREQEAAIATQKALEHLSRPDPSIGWDGNYTPTKRETFTKFVEQFGIPNEEQTSVRSPGWVKLVHLAMIGKETLSKSKQVSKPAPKPAVKPVPTVTSGKTSAATVDPDKLSPEQWVKWREAQIRKQNK